MENMYYITYTNAIKYYRLYRNNFTAVSFSLNCWT